MDISRILRALQQEGYPLTRADVATLSPYLTEHIKRFGDYQVEGLNDAGVIPDDDVLPFALDDDLF